MKPEAKKANISAREHIHELEDKVRRLKYMGDGLRNELFDTSQRGHRLASDMGFENIEDAESAVAARPRIFNRLFIENAATRVELLETQVAKHIELDAEAREALVDASQEIHELKKENERLVAELIAANQQNEALKGTLDRFEGKLETPVRPLASTTGLPTPALTVVKKRALGDVTPLIATSSPVLHKENIVSSRSNITPQLSPFVDDHSDSPVTDLSLLSARYTELREKYETLQDQKKRDDAKYKDHYLKWKNFKQWITNRQEGSLSDTMIDGKPVNLENLQKVRKNYLMRGPRVSIPESANLSDVAVVTKASATPPTTDEIKETRTSDRNEFAEALPPSSLTRRLLEEAQQDAIDSAVMKPRIQHSPNSSPIATPSRRRGRKRKYGETLSSETEDDSQAPDPVYFTQPGLRIRRLASNSNQCQRDGAAQADHTGLSKDSADVCKSGRVVQEGVASSSLSRSSTPHRSSTGTTSTARNNADKENGSVQRSTKARSGDYSVYKGRGRYAAPNSSEDAAINALYEIDPVQNGGVQFQFEEVVRNKERRKRLDAGDCDDCRNYYDAVGPLPARLKPPLWRSPQSSPSRRKTHCHKHKHNMAGPSTSFDPDFDSDETGRREQDVRQHKQEISRHRQRWAPPTTPPKYWSIGFPDTQETVAINDRAREMHAEKRARIEREAE
ncbi:uncharacterized protein FIBRA_07851 [Fibroporia radiculosa]|uniref:DNA endonuclease activator Ctp1 C-terminal domain-containing protein n=1 Tax=Fibroporia radiculosa TaxID=599839 RepID=J4I1I0_9APHY|nr:uncharacterized protein FIBRA_07851 [Fibroporia radiculosa]CCM05622.1 predicted protein [Fibroporia radiculosa]